MYFQRKYFSRSFWIYAVRPVLSNSSVECLPSDTRESGRSDIDYFGSREPPGHHFASEPFGLVCSPVIGHRIALSLDTFKMQYRLYGLELELGHRRSTSSPVPGEGGATIFECNGAIRWRKKWLHEQLGLYHDYRLRRPWSLPKAQPAVPVS